MKGFFAIWTSYLFQVQSGINLSLHLPPAQWTFETEKPVREELVELPYWATHWWDLSCLGRGCNVPLAEEKLQDNGLGSPWWEAGGVTRMYLWWIVTVSSLLWDTVWFKSKILHSLVLVGTVVAFPCRRLWCMVFDRDYSIFPTVLQSKVGETTVMVTRPEVAWWLVSCF